MAILSSGLFQATAAALLLALGVYKLIIYPAFLSPLAKIPNAHFTSPLSPLWILWRRFRMTGNRTIHAAHMKHGPIVRLGPSEVSINCYEGGLRTVYTGGYEKHEWYPRLFGSFGTISMFSMVGSKEHSARKRMLANIYSKSYLQASPQLKAVTEAILFDRLFPVLEGYAKSESSVEVHELNNAIALDFITAYIFGLPAASNFIQNPLPRKEWFSIYHSRKEFEFYIQETPELLSWSHKLGFPLIPKWCDGANAFMEKWGLDTCDKAEENLSSSDPIAAPVVYRQLKQALQKHFAANPDPRLEGQDVAQKIRLEVACETFDHLTAGHETSAITLTYLFWELSKNPEIQEKLRTELKTLVPNVIPLDHGGSSKLPPHKSIDALPLLDAIVMETLRLHPPIPGIQPRLTPADASLVGYHNLPPNTRVNAQAYSLHKNEDVFPNADSWLPDRWLAPAGSPQLDEMKRWFWAFGSGGRMCIGSHFALQEIKLVVAALYTNYTTRVVEDKGMEPIDAYTTRPTGNKLTLQFGRA
ncbi:cytochrome P450 monooxygenase [Trichophyton equinum CBS 127.97]|uniref:Cytochrome P450 monooxygenase n=1 Tax=Trichophyton equinum (strain ATCC MYA-4606 / CBS 127.97) TaxID=559882 RepID=F2PWK9_TRIEC|nr:cytochrome P450 monooxygenase [Trichophyton equinum CBS 127.97]